MVAPITGPFAKTVTLKGPPTCLGFAPDHFYRSQQWYRQRKPYNLPLGYTLNVRKITRFWISPAYCTGYTDISQAFPINQTDGISDDAYAKAYNRFKNALYERAELSVGLAERRQAMDMVSRRCLQLWKFSRNLRRFRFGDAASDLGISRSQVKSMNLRSSSKAFGNNFLEFYFGWSPLIGDIGKAVEILQGGVPPSLVYASASSRRSWKESTGADLSVQQSSCNAKVTWRIQSLVSVTNPNLFLANQLGFVNPATVLWELVPFSFVVDWFVNVSDFLGSFSDFFGLTLTEPARTYYRVRQNTTRYVNHPNQKNWDAIWCDVQRTLGPIPGPALRIREPKALSPARGLTAISLLLQSMPNPRSVQARPRQTPVYRKWAENAP